MKKFIEVLKENGIRIPKETEWMPSWMFTRMKKTFYRKWDDAHRCYNILIKEFKKKTSEYQMYDKMLLEKGYEVKMPALPDIDIKPFKRPKKAADQIHAAYERLRDHNSRQMYEITEREGREKWAKKTLLNKPEGCEFMVVKNTEYSPSKECIELFETSTAEGKASCIHGMFGIPQWIAFNPQSEKAYEALMRIPADPRSISVEFI